MKQKLKTIGGCVIALLILVGIIAIYLASQNWMVRFRAELDDFFGKGNWECISEETNESTIYTEYYSSHDSPGISEEIPGKYKDWYISFVNHGGETEEWRITNHVYKINHDSYGIFSSKRYSAKQALTLELMDIAFQMAGDKLRRELIETVLSEEESECMRVEISYQGGNPKPGFYNKLAKQPWFNVRDVSAEKFLAYDEYDFYIDIGIYTYGFEKLTEEQQQNILNNFEVIKQMLIDAYGEHAAFDMYFDSEHRIEYGL